MQLDRAGIAARIPHQGSMCLLDRVLEWDAGTIRCSATSHRASDNPLRAHGRLGAACGIEYAAQAMAVHGALCAATHPRVGAAGIGSDGEPAPRIGMLAGVRGVDLHASRLDDQAADLLVQAERVTGDRSAVIYAFMLRAGERILVTGRATVLLYFDARGNAG